MQQTYIFLFLFIMKKSNTNFYSQELINSVSNMKYEEIYRKFITFKCISC